MCALCIVKLLCGRYLCWCCGRFVGLWVGLAGWSRGCTVVRLLLISIKWTFERPVKLPVLLKPFYSWAACEKCVQLVTKIYRTLVSLQKQIFGLLTGRLLIWYITCRSQKHQLLWLSGRGVVLHSTKVHARFPALAHFDEMKCKNTCTAILVVKINLELPTMVYFTTASWYWHINSQWLWVVKATAH